MTDAQFGKHVQRNRSKGDPPRCDECELPLEEITHGYVYEWACANDLCAKRFQRTYAEPTDPELLIIMGRPQCYRCLQPRRVTRWGPVLRFECADPRCNELVWLINAKSRQANKTRSEAGIMRLPRAQDPVEPEVIPAPLTLVPPMSQVEPTVRRRGSPIALACRLPARPVHELSLGCRDLKADAAVPATRRLVPNRRVESCPRWSGREAGGGKSVEPPRRDLSTLFEKWSVGALRKVGHCCVSILWCFLVWRKAGW